MARHGLSVDGKVQVVSELSAAIAAIQDRMARSLYIKDLAERLQVDESAILERVRGLVGGRPTAVRRRAATAAGAAMAGASTAEVQW